MLWLVSLSHIRNLGSPKICKRRGEKHIFGQKDCKTNIILWKKKKVCVLFAVCLIHARQDSPGERRGGVWGKQLQPSHCINWGLPQISGWSPAVQQLLESGRFYSLLLRMFLFLALAFLSSAALPSSTGGSTQLSFLRNCTGDSGPCKHLSHQQFWCRHVQRAWIHPLLHSWTNWFPKTLVNYNQQLSGCGCSMDKDIFENINKIQNNIQNYSPQKFCVALVGDKSFELKEELPLDPLDRNRVAYNCLCWVSTTLCQPPGHQHGGNSTREPLQSCYPLQNNSFLKSSLA